ncbi:hypothetical protein BDP27DRAFT_1371225 [Rhodocollybia butyracea]|uniref:Uncharacterized protein n=1 Tax=Rhodocollybia butyracea TaxID=206335 RepID=A0A9P5PA86_9AGAR|nr:hypothetical protein BDP27DRAFT_1371225 [Rhodocollybia butyracea]
MTLANSTIKTTSVYPGTIIARMSALSQICMQPEEPYPLFNHFTQISLDNVTSLILDNTLPDDPDDPYLSQLNSACRSLPCVAYVTIHFISVEGHNRYLTLFPLTTDNRPGTLQLPPSVHTLGFWFRHPKATTQAWREFCRTLSLIHGEGIKVIHFRTETAEDLRSRYTAQKAMNETLQAKGWRLEVGDIYV